MNYCDVDLYILYDYKIDHLGKVLNFSLDQSMSTSRYQTLNGLGGITVSGITINSVKIARECNRFSFNDFFKITGTSPRHQSAPLNIWAVFGDRRVEMRGCWIKSSSMEYRASDAIQIETVDLYVERVYDADHSPADLIPLTENERIIKDIIE